MAGSVVLNGNGEVTGTAWIAESGFLEGPIMLTNTESVGTVRDATITWRRRQGPADASGSFWSLPVVAETWDGRLNDLGAQHVRAEHAFAALDGAQSGHVPEGNAGGGTGMHTHGWKGGTGTASRRVGDHILGVLVQSNYGRAPQLTIAGVPVGSELVPPLDPAKENGSIIVIMATDAPLLPHQLQRLARRAPLALGRMGSYAGNSSGDFMLAFSTANSGTAYGEDLKSARFIGNDGLDAFFIAAVEATEEAIVNALVAAETLDGQNGARLHAIPHEELRKILSNYGRGPAPK
jgi:L-aminopeptidase/D-esterase-like protein